MHNTYVLHFLNRKTPFCASWKRQVGWSLCVLSRCSLCCWLQYWGWCHDSCCLCLPPYSQLLLQCPWGFIDTVLIHFAHGVVFVFQLVDAMTSSIAFSALTLLVGRQDGHPACKKTEWWSAGVVICLEWGADLHIAQLMPLPLTVSCFSKIQIGFTFLVPADLGTPRKRAVKRVCVCVCC